MRKKSIGSNDNAKSSTSTAYQRGNNRDGSPHYVFLYSDDDDDDADGNNDDDENINANKYNKNIPLQVRNNKLRKDICPRKVEVITVTLKPEDTLQALALRYRCTISELKRINNIHKENEIFARRIVKVPVPPFSILTEIDNNISDYRNEQQQRQNELTNKTIEAVDITNSIVGGIINDGEQKEIIISPTTGNSSNNYNNSKNDDINKIILNSLSIDPLRNDVTNDNFHINDNENDELLINERHRDSTPEARVIELFGCSGADWGLTWVHLLGASLLLGFVLPVIYYLCLTEDHQYIHHKNVTGS